jgi:hypothetical protein
MQEWGSVGDTTEQRLEGCYYRARHAVVSPARSLRRTWLRPEREASPAGSKRQTIPRQHIGQCHTVMICEVQRKRSRLEPEEASLCGL